ISCCVFNLYKSGGQDAHPTRFNHFRIIQFRCVTADHVRPITDDIVHHCIAFSQLPITHYPLPASTDMIQQVQLQ
ncbi:MAG: hypothetical protein ACKPGB_29775, partial [Dolichospermum sp.]